MWGGDSNLHDRDLDLLQALSHACVLSTAQLSQLGEEPEPAATFAFRMVRLWRSGRIHGARIVTGNGPITAWWRGDLPFAISKSLAADLIRLNALYVSLRSDFRLVEWQAQPEPPVSATLWIPKRLLHLTWADNPAAASAYLRFCCGLRDADHGIERRLKGEALLLCGDIVQRDRVRREVGCVRRQIPGGSAAFHVSTFSDAVRILRKRLRGARFQEPPDPPCVELSAKQHGEIRRFFETVF